MLRQLQLNPANTLLINTHEGHLKWGTLLHSAGRQVPLVPEELFYVYAKILFGVTYPILTHLLVHPEVCACLANDMTY